MVKQIKSLRIFKDTCEIFNLQGDEMEREEEVGMGLGDY